MLLKNSTKNISGTVKHSTKPYKMCSRTQNIFVTCANIRHKNV